MREKPNPKLEELKRKWENDYFGLDAAGVYGVGEAIEEAIDHISMYDREERVVEWRGQSYRTYAYDLPTVGQHDIGIDSGKRKTCRICHRARVRNDPCDPCYKMVRDAAEWTDEWGTMEVYPCAMCDDEVYSTICGSCMDIMLGK